MHRALDAATRHHLLRYGLIARVALLTQAATTVGLAWLSDGSLTARLLAQGGAVGQMVLVLMTAMVVIGWLDLLANDMLRLARQPAPMLRAARRNEHAGFLVLGVLYWVQAMAGAGITEPGAWVLVVSYLLMGAWCCWFGWASAIRGGRHG